ncbi:hypothetical protein BASA61_008701 [Batrachochytrium salamandrivorans]|nr:hypothetical protein BASA61_008701 [Batrachochytrium salamandrivorans]
MTKYSTNDRKQLRLECRLLPFQTIFLCFLSSSSTSFSSFFSIIIRSSSTTSSPLPPSSGGSSPPSLRKVVNDDDSEKPSSSLYHPKSDSRPEVQRPIIDISEVNLKPVGQRPKPQHMPKSPSYQFQLRKMAHGGSTDQVSPIRTQTRKRMRKNHLLPTNRNLPKLKFHLPSCHVPI